MIYSKLLRRSLSFGLIAVLLTSVFLIPGNAVLAEEGDEEDTITYYDAEGNVIEDPYTADVCYDEAGNEIDCPEEETDEEDDADSENRTGDIPPGQLVRRGLSGPIVGVGEGYVLVETNFGVVKVYMDGDVDESMIGQKIAVKLRERERTQENAGDNTTDSTGNTTDGTGYYREASAEQFKLIPSKSQKEHRWGTVESTDDGCFLVDDEGNQVPVDCGNATGDMIGLVAPQDGDGEPVLVGSENPSRIQERIQQRLERAEEEGDAKTMERLQQQLERYEAKQVERQGKKEARAKARADKANKDKGKPEDKGQGNAKKDK